MKNKYKYTFLLIVLFLYSSIQIVIAAGKTESLAVDAGESEMNFDALYQSIQIFN